MTNSIQLSPDYIQQIINEEEIPLRSSTFGPDITQLAFRYGAVIGSVIEQHNQISRGADLTRKIILAAEEKDESFHSGTVILADEMIHSKGRFKRYWHAPKGGLWMTLALVNTLLPESSLLLPMAGGSARSVTTQLNRLGPDLPFTPVGQGGF